MAFTDVVAPERLSAADAEGALSLSVEAGWNQTAADWRFMLKQGSGIGVRDTTGRWVASALTLPLGGTLCWVSMVLVTRGWRRRGIGTHLLTRCIGALRDAGAVPGLDATELGRPVYLPLGFRDLYGVTRWRIGQLTSSTRAGEVDARPASPDDLVRLGDFDAQRSGMQRAPILRYLL